MNTNYTIIVWAKFFMSVFLIVLFGVFNNFAQQQWTKYAENPVLASGSNGEWDSDGCAGYSVVIEGSMYKMWYGAWDGVTFQIGYAYSSDGINWTKYNDTLTTSHPYLESDPVLKLGPGAWESVWVYYPQVYFDGNTYHMWYAGNNGTNDRIGYATSPDGITWTKHGTPVLNIGTTGSG